MAELNKAMQELDDLFASAREAPRHLPDHLNKAILADAVTARSEAAVAEPAVKPVVLQRQGFWRQLLLAVGGLPTIGGFAVACAAGVWIGLEPPSFLPDPAQLVGYSDSTSVPYDSYDLAVMLGEEVQ
ncbi:hypothetical protein [Parasedimentitalea maritima]|uniref:Dihydroorotate dehydrogenase n=1 Tax=Parasedimentitalea maritima TaxID=2578117 RepID=A0A6A4RJU9_9RHOB|nr:hypothetical protein [Zongyanglinia marina]KAE9629964.1 hypothetical protein GP644_09725 [Zongyanglinia marina]